MKYLSFRIFLATKGVCFHVIVFLIVNMIDAGELQHFLKLRCELLDVAVCDSTRMAWLNTFSTSSSYKSHELLSVVFGALFFSSSITGTRVQESGPKHALVLSISPDTGVRQEKLALSTRGLMIKEYHFSMI